MLTGNFENKTNVLIMGDALDLAELQKTLYKVTSMVAGYELEDSDLFLLFTHFSQKTEGAWLAGNPQKNSVYGKAEVYYHSFESSTMELFLLTSLLRALSSFLIINDLDEVNIYLLENLSKRAVSGNHQQQMELIRERVYKTLESSGIKRFIQDFRCYETEQNEPAEELRFEAVTRYLVPAVAGLFVRI